jgi:hypothetical protein
MACHAAFIPASLKCSNDIHDVHVHRVNAVNIHEHLITSYLINWVLFCLHMGKAGNVCGAIGMK